MTRRAALQLPRAEAAPRKVFLTLLSPEGLEPLRTGRGNAGPEPGHRLFPDVPDIALVVLHEGGQLAEGRLTPRLCKVHSDTSPVDGAVVLSQCERVADAAVLMGGHQRQSLPTALVSGGQCWLRGVHLNCNILAVGEEYKDPNRLRNNVGELAGRARCCGGTTGAAAQPRAHALCSLGARPDLHPRRESSRGGDGADALLPRV
jgi:hypothetical protein